MAAACYTVPCHTQLTLLLSLFLPPPPGDTVLAGSSTLTLEASSLQQMTRLFEQHLLSRSQQHGFLAQASHPGDTVSLLQLQFLFDMLQKTVSLKVGGCCFPVFCCCFLQVS